MSSNNNLFSLLITEWQFTDSNTVKKCSVSSTMYTNNGNQLKQYRLLIILKKHEYLKLVHYPKNNKPTIWQLPKASQENPL